MIADVGHLHADLQDDVDVVPCGLRCDYTDAQAVPDDVNTPPGTNPGTGPIRCRPMPRRHEEQGAGVRDQDTKAWVVQNQTSDQGGGGEPRQRRRMW